MINVSNKWKQSAADMVKNESSNRQFTGKATITLKDGTILNVDESDIAVGGLTFNHATTDNNKFQIGTAIIGQNGLVLNNIEDKFGSYDFDGAVIIPFSGLKLSSGTEFIKKGVYNAYNFNTVAGTVIFENRDNMQKFEKPFSDVSATFPISAFDLLYAVCQHCGVVLATTTFTKSNHVIQRRPDDEAITCREIVAWIAGISGNFARCNIDGALELKWYDFEAFETSDNINGGIFDNNTPYASGDSVNGGTFDNNTPYSSGDTVNGGTFLDMDRYHHIYAMGSATIGTDDVVITGVQVKAIGTESDYGETYLYGTSGYVISIDNNPLIQEGTAQEIATAIGQKIVGMRFRPMQITAISDPSREAGDVAYVPDRKGNYYQTLITNISYKIGSMDTISCDAETPARNNSTRYSAATKAEVKARQEAQQQISSYDATVQQFTNLITNGFGLFQTKVVDSSGGTIYYMHDKPTMDESVIRWFMSTGGMIEQRKESGVWVTVSATDNQGNALYNVITARGIVADWIKTGKISATDNSSWIDLDNGELSFANGAIRYQGGQFIIDTANLKFNGDGTATLDNTTVNGTVNALWANIGELRIDENKITRKDELTGRVNEIEFSGNSFSIRSVILDEDGNPTGRYTGVTLFEDELYIFFKDENDQYDNDSITINDINFGNFVDEHNYLWDTVLNIENYLDNKFGDYFDY